jgi:hypothetical protein
VTPGRRPEPGGDARAAAPARPDRTTKPGTTFITAITTGHRQETHECGNLRTLLRRVPLSCANQGWCQAERVRERRQDARPDPAFTRLTWLVPDNSGNRDGSCPDTHRSPVRGRPDTPPKPGPQLSGYSTEARSSAILGS